MDKENTNLSEDWNLTDSLCKNIWPGLWNQLNPLEITAIKKIIESGDMLNIKQNEIPGGMGCNFSIDLERMYYLLAIIWYLQHLTGITNEEIREKLKSFVEKQHTNMRTFYKETIEPKLDYLISLLNKKH